MPTTKRPHKFPLWLHSSGQWCKKHRGQFYYFGSEKDTALKRYAAEWDDLKAGRKVRTTPGSYTLADAVNHFLTAKLSQVESGELATRSFGDYKRTCGIVVDELGRSRTLADIRPDDFAKLRRKLATKYNAVTLGGHVQRVRTLFKHAYEAELIDAPLRYGNAFAKPSRRTIRIDRADKAPRLFESADILRLVEAAGTPLDAMILLGINCGFGQGDCSELPRSALKRAGWLDFRRPKTGTPRRCPLWPETVAAIERATSARPAATDPADDGLVFITKYGRRFVRYTEGSGEKFGYRIDGIGQEFQKLAKRLGLPGGFYHLRHTFRTIADGARDYVATGLVMGHVDDSMASVYRERIEDDRLEAVVNHVRAWLWPARTLESIN